MNRQFFANVEWMGQDSEGRVILPLGERYAAPVRIDNEPWDTFKQDAWTLVVDRVAAPDDRHWTVKVQYLFDDAPHDRLRPGANFELYEGRKCVAKGIIGESAG